MIPVRDVIPARTPPRVTLALLAAMGVACASPAVRGWWLPWVSHAVALWLAGPALEDRLGHARFALLTAAVGAAAAAAPAAAGWGIDPAWIVAGAVAGVLAAYLVMFPTSRIVALVPVIVGVEIAEVPAWAVFALWALLQAATGWSALAWSSRFEGATMAVSAVSGVATGMLGIVLLRRPERMRVDWWDPPARQP